MTAQISTNSRIVKEFDLNGKHVRIHSIPCIPGIELFTECSSVVDSVRWEDINSKGLEKLAAYASVEIEGTIHRLDNVNACIAFLDTAELWQICLEVYAANFGFFMRGGIQLVMKPLLEAQKAAVAAAGAQASGASTAT